MPFGQVPVLDVDGQILAQSNTISRYLARKHGLAGKDEWEQAQADMYADNINDLMTGNWKLDGEIIRLVYTQLFHFFLGMRPAFLEKDAEKQKELYQKFLVDNVAPHVAIVEKQLEKNGSGHLVGTEVCDLCSFY